MKVKIFTEGKFVKVVGNTPKGDKKKVLEKACQQFEALFVYYMFKMMRKTVPKSGLIGGGFADAVYTSMFDQKVSEEIAKRGGIGIADLLMRQIEGKYTEHIPSPSDKTVKGKEVGGKL